MEDGSLLQIEPVKNQAWTELGQAQIGLGWVLMKFVFGTLNGYTKIQLAHPVTMGQCYGEYSH